MEENIIQIVTEIKGQLNGLIQVQTLDSEAIRQELKSTKEILQTEVHQALNKHHEMKERIMLQDLKISELEKREYACPIASVALDVDMLKRETRQVRAIETLPEVKKGMKVWKAIEIAGIVVLATATLLSLWLNIKNAIL